MRRSNAPAGWKISALGKLIVREPGYLSWLHFTNPTPLQTPFDLLVEVENFGRGMPNRNAVELHHFDMSARRSCDLWVVPIRGDFHTWLHVNPASEKRWLESVGDSLYTRAIARYGQYPDAFPDLLEFLNTYHWR